MTGTVLLIATDSFKGSLSAHEAAWAMAQGIVRVWPEVTVERMPLSDGGDGLIEVVAGPTGAEVQRSTVTGPRGTPRDVQWLYDHEHARAWIAASEVVPLDAVGAAYVGVGTSRGVGELIRLAQDSGAERVVLGIGGTGTVDGGAGSLVGLGARLLDSAGRPIDPGLDGLTQVAAVEPPERPLPDIELLCDVTSPLTGPEGAAAIFGPQKGLDEAGCAAADEALRHWAGRLDEAFGCDPAELPFGGAGGGLAAGLMAGCAAVPRPGVARVAELLGLEAAVARATIVITGEGRVDVQSDRGKVVGHVLELAARHGKPVQVLAGLVTDAGRQWLASRGARSEAAAPEGLPLELALRDATKLLEDAAARAFDGPD